MKQAYGDNIYFKIDKDQWRQIDSHHSYENGTPNPYNIQHDTNPDRVLIGFEYIYWGGDGPRIDETFRSSVCAKRNHKSIFSPNFIDDFITWLHSLGTHGYLGEPLDWPKTS